MIVPLRRLAWPAALGALLALELAVLFPGLLTGVALPSSQEGWTVSDLLDVAVPLQGFVADRLRHGEFPSWYPGGFLGMRLTAVPEAIPWYLPSTLLFVLAAPGRAAAWGIALHLLLAGAGGAALARRFGASRAGSTLTALCLAGGLWLPAHARQYNLLLTAAWSPWVWWAFAGWLVRPTLRSAALLGLLSGCSLLAGHAQMTHHLVVTLAVWGGARLASDPSLRSQEHLRRLAQTGLLAAGLALVLGAPHLVPVAELAAQGVRRNTFADGVTRFPARLSDLLAVAGRGALAGDPARLWLARPLWWEFLTYVGTVPLALSLVGLVRGPVAARRGSVHVALVASLAVTLALALSTASGFTASLVAHLPGVTLFRFLGRFLWPATIALAVAAAFGVDAVRSHAALSARPRLATFALAAAIALTVLDLGGVVSPLCPLASADLLTREPRTSLALRAARPDAQRGAVIQLVSDHDRNLAGMVAGWGRHPAILAEAREFLPPQHASLFGWNNLRGYVGITTAAAQRAIGDQYVGGDLVSAEVAGLASPTGPDFAKLLLDASLLGARWVVSATPLEHPHLHLLHQAHGAVLDVYAYRLDPWFSAAHFVDAHGAPLVTPATRLTARRPEAIEVRAAYPERATLRVPVAWNPRWRVSLDGGPWRPAPRPTGLMMELPWPASTRGLRLRFDARADQALVAAALTALALALFLVGRRDEGGGRQPSSADT